MSYAYFFFIYRLYLLSFSSVNHASRGQRPWDKTGTEARFNLLNIAVDLTKNPVWVNGMGAYFDTVDVDKTGTVDIDEFLQ